MNWTPDIKELEENKRKYDHKMEKQKEFLKKSEEDKYINIYESLKNRLMTTNKNCIKSIQKYYNCYGKLPDIQTLYDCSFNSIIQFGNKKYNDRLQKAVYQLQKEYPILVTETKMTVHGGLASYNTKAWKVQIILNKFI